MSQGTFELRELALIFPAQLADSRLAVISSELWLDFELFKEKAADVLMQSAGCIDQVAWKTALLSNARQF